MLKRSYDVAIVGGGVMGSSIAYHLSKLALDAEKKLSIAVIEKDKKYVNASAMLSAGGLRQQFSAAENTRMSMYGAEFLKTPEILQVNDCLPCYQVPWMLFSCQHILCDISKTCAVPSTRIFVSRRGGQSSCHEAQQSDTAGMRCLLDGAYGPTEAADEIPMVEHGEH